MELVLFGKNTLFLTDGQKQSRCKGYKNPRGGKYSRRVSRFSTDLMGFEYLCSLNNNLSL